MEATWRDCRKQIIDEVMFPDSEIKVTPRSTRRRLVPIGERGVRRTDRGWGVHATGRGLLHHPPIAVAQAALDAAAGEEERADKGTGVRR
jgi:hypothetical protein